MPGFPGNYRAGQMPASDGAGGWKPGAIITPTLDAGAMSIGAVTTAPVKGTVLRDKVFAKRLGDLGWFRYEYEQSAAGTAGSGDYLFSLPNGYAFGPSVDFLTGAYTTSAHSMRPATGLLMLAGVANVGAIIPFSATRFRIHLWAVNGASAGIMGTAYAGSLAGVGLTAFAVEFVAPIAGWDEKA